MKQYKERQGQIDVAAVLDNPHCFEIRIFKHYEDVGAKEYTKLRNTRILPSNFAIMIHSRTDRRSDLKSTQTKQVISAINSRRKYEILPAFVSQNTQIFVVTLLYCRGQLQ